MLKKEFLKHLLQNEGKFSYSRSPGPGGQNVNKLNTKVSLSFDVLESSLQDQTKKKICKKLSCPIQTQAHETRSRERNKDIAIEKMIEKIFEALKVEKPRKKTHLSKSQKEKRLQNKHHASQKKHDRKSPKMDFE